jgi:HlyD family secretion protein
VALGVGQITSIEVEVGDRVEKGQVIARVAQPELTQQIGVLEARLAELRAVHEKTMVAGRQDTGLRLQASAQQRQNLESAIAANEQRAKELEERLASQTRLYQKGLVTKEVVDNTREALRSAEVSITGMRADMQRVAVDRFSAERANDTALMNDQLQIQETERQLRLQREKLEQNTTVVSTHTGRVVELRAMVGDLLAPGTPVVSLERADEQGTLEAVLYVDYREGKLLRPGMEVQLSPSIVKKERHGVLLGRVKSVEDFPSTRRGMMRILHNEQLVDSFLAEAQGTLIALRAELLVDPGTPSGYRWSSGSGPDLLLTSGTRCSARVTTRTQRPIALLFPLLDSAK